MPDERRHNEKDACGGCRTADNHDFGGEILQIFLVKDASARGDDEEEVSELRREGFLKSAEGDEDNAREDHASRDDVRACEVLFAEDGDRENKQRDHFHTSEE